MSPAMASPRDMEHAIRARGLTRRFGSVTAVDGIDLDIPGASIYGFLGSDQGSGESTTIRMCAACCNRVPGAVRRARSRNAPRCQPGLRTQLGYMTQESTRSGTTSAWQREPPVHGPGLRLPAQRRRARVAVVVGTLETATLFEQRAGTLDDDERQRLGSRQRRCTSPTAAAGQTTSAVDAPESS